jgi:glutathione synthase/RimK-type ligase-like ATP-grasp enzyme
VSPTKESRDTAQDGSHEPLMGLAKLMTMAYSGVDLAPLGARMIERVNADPADTNALMDLSTIMQLDFAPDLAATFQELALSRQRLYRLPAAGAERIRLLAIMASGNLMANAPLEFLLEGSDVTLQMLYLSPDQEVPESLPEHDVAFVAVNERDDVRALLERLAAAVEGWTRPVLNHPARIARLARDRAWPLLSSAPGVVIAATARVDKTTLSRIGDGTQGLDTVIEAGDFPILVRPVGSHAGQGLAKLDTAAAIESHLQGRAEQEFYVTPFVDYQGRDGLFRKCRIALIDGRAYPCHMAISQHWMIHYLNAGMSDSEEKRAEEARFMAEFDRDFAARHRPALRAIHERTGLDYLIVDCAETRDGQLLVFEVDSGAVIHAMDAVDVFPYKRPQMHKVFAAFRDLLISAVERGADRPPPTPGPGGARD